jgi:glycosyltransferase involved in cell wall biosynthesis
MPHRILYVITKTNWGGAQRYVYDLALAAREVGHEILVVSGTEGELTERLRDAGVATKSIPSLVRDVNIFTELRALRELVRITRNYSPDIIHGNSSKGGIYAGIAGRLCRVPSIVFTAHGWAFNEARPWWQRKIIASIHWLTILLSHKTICVSDAIAHDIEHLPFIRKKLTVVHSGIEPQFSLDRYKARELLAPHLVATPLWIGTIAELHPVKQIDVLIKAFARLSQVHPHMALVLMGEGSERERLETLVREQGLATRIHFCGHVREASSYLSALDIFVFPSRSEALGYALLEAGSAGLPSVASAVGGIPEIITDQESGLLVPSGDISALTEALHLLLVNAELRVKIGRALNERVSRVFSREQMLRETFALYSTQH